MKNIWPTWLTVALIGLFAVAAVLGYIVGE